MENQVFYQENEEISGTVHLKQAKKVFSRVGWGVFTFLIVSSLAQILMMVLFPRWSQQGIGFWISAFAPIYLIGLPAAVLVLGKKPAQQIPVTPMKPGRYLSLFLIALFIMGAGNLLGTLILTILNQVAGTSTVNPVEVMMAGENLWMVLLTAVVIGPAAEEFVFRKLLIDRMVPYGEKTAILVSALLFGLFHGNLSQFFYAFPLGILLGYVYVRTGKLRFSLGLHMMLNFLCGFLPLLIMSNLDPEIMETISLETLSRLESMDAQRLMMTVQWILTYAAYGLLIFGAEIAGLVMLCKRFKKAEFAKAQCPIPAKGRMGVVFGNAGMILIILACLALMIISLFP